MNSGGEGDGRCSPRSSYSWSSYTRPVQVSPSPRLACSIYRWSPRGQLTLYRRTEEDGVRGSVTNVDRVRGRGDKMRSCLEAGRQGSGCKTEEKRNWYIAWEEWAGRLPPLLSFPMRISCWIWWRGYCLCRKERSNRPIVFRTTLRQSFYQKMYFIKIKTKKVNCSSYVT